MPQANALTVTLEGFQVISLAVNVPGPVAAARLAKLGAQVTKVEPPSGDFLAAACPAWYTELVAGQEIIRLNLKDPPDRERLMQLLETADLLLTATRPASLERLGLGWNVLHERFPRLSQVAIVGHPAPDDDIAGHDLNYQASLGLLTHGHLPRTLLADLSGAERAVSAALGLLLNRERGMETGYAHVSLAEAAAAFTPPLRYGLTTPDGPLGGGLASYAVYPAKSGHITLAALEPQFLERVVKALDLAQATHADFARVFATRTAEDWERWAKDLDLPIAAVRDVHGSTSLQLGQRTPAELPLRDDPPQQPAMISSQHGKFEPTMHDKEQRVANLLLSHRVQEEGFWPGLFSDKPVTLADANRFMLGAVLDYQIKSETAWANGKRLAESISGDPERPWAFIAAMPFPEWKQRWKQYSLHRFPKAHERLWRISQGVLQYYNGDPRRIWENQSISEVLARLNFLKVGEQISRMIVGALIDTGKLRGKADVKPDIHICRVLGRVKRGSGFDVSEVGEVINLTRRMSPDNPWLLDRELYLIGKGLCRPQSPDCKRCYLADECAFCIGRTEVTPIFWTVVK